MSDMSYEFHTHGNQMNDAIDRIKTLSDFMQFIPKDESIYLSSETIPDAGFIINKSIAEIERLVEMLESDLRAARGLPSLVPLSEAS